MDGQPEQGTLTPETPKKRGGNLVPYQFKPGGPPGPGRAKGSGLTDIIRKCLNQPDETYGTKADKLIALCVQHAERGDFRFFKEIMDRLDGPVATRQEISGPDGGPVPVAHKVVVGDCWEQA